MCEITLSFTALVCTKILILNFLILVCLMMANHGQTIFFPKDCSTAPAIFSFNGSLLAYDVALLIPLLTPGHGIERIAKLNCIFNVIAGHFIFIYIMLLVTDKQPESKDATDLITSVTEPQDLVLLYLGIRMKPVAFFKILCPFVIAAMLLEFSICLCACFSAQEQKLAERLNIIVSKPAEESEPRTSTPDDEIIEPSQVSFLAVEMPVDEEVREELVEIPMQSSNNVILISNIQLQTSLTSVAINTEEISVGVNTEDE